jgi:hypothetical protein
MPGLASVEGCRSATNGLVSVMKSTMQKAFIASLGAVALLLATDLSFARSGGAPGAGARAMPPAGAHAFRQHRRNFIGSAVGGYYYGADGAPLLDAPQAQPASNDVRYTYTYDVPWDWAHRYPPNVVPSDRPYVPGCGAETVTVPGRGGRDQTVNITRCY